MYFLTLFYANIEICNGKKKTEEAVVQSPKIKNLVKRFLRILAGRNCVLVNLAQEYI